MSGRPNIKYESEAMYRNLGRYVSNKVNIFSDSTGPIASVRSTMSDLFEPLKGQLSVSINRRGYL